MIVLTWNQVSMFGGKKKQNANWLEELEIFKGKEKNKRRTGRWERPVVIEKSLPGSQQGGEELGSFFFTEK